MAFCIDVDTLLNISNQSNKASLYIKRNDKESPKDVNGNNYDLISDWPCFEKGITRNVLLNTIYDRVYRYVPLLRNCIRERWKEYAYHYFRLLMIKDGVKFISPFNQIVSERLHGCILAILLGKEVVVINNSYGKNKNFYDAWLKEFDNVTLKEV